MWTPMVLILATSMKLILNNENATLELQMTQPKTTFLLASKSEKLEFIGLSSFNAQNDGNCET